MPGANNLGLVESAVNAVVNQIYYEGCEDPLDLAGTYLFRIVSNHGFLDGNKRAGMAAALVFLRLNGYETNHPEFEEITMDVAASRITEAETKERIKALYVK